MRASPLARRRMRTQNPAHITRGGIHTDKGAFIIIHDCGTFPPRLPPSSAQQTRRQCPGGLHVSMAGFHHSSACSAPRGPQSRARSRWARPRWTPGLSCTRQGNGCSAFEAQNVPHNGCPPTARLCVLAIDSLWVQWCGSRWQPQVGAPAVRLLAVL